jgi:YesN/AraC family two-component response regulator
MLLDQDAEIGLIEEAANGTQAAELMLTGTFDLIFLDVQMPEMMVFPPCGGLEQACPAPSSS